MSIEQLTEVKPLGDYKAPISLAYSEGLDSSKAFDSYFLLREEAALQQKPEGEELADIQNSVRHWAESTGVLNMPDSQEGRVEYYRNYDERKAHEKLLGLVDFLELEHYDKISDVELEATRAFVESTFAMYHDEASSEDGVMADANGSFAFIVPARMSRKNTEYGAEVEPVIPALRYMPNELRAQMLVGLPPFVIDTYRKDETGKQGYLVLAPVFEDMQDDITSRSALMVAARGIVNDAIDFSRRRFGIEVAGLGATLPSLTQYGKTIKNKDVITTTGHGGTAELIIRTMDNGLNGKAAESIGVLGLGAIGASVAEVIADRYPDVRVSLFDIDRRRAEKLDSQEPGRYTIAESGERLVSECEVVISAITGRFDVPESVRLDGTLIIDDAQPASFDPEQVSDRGGNVLWVIGEDTQGTVASRTGYDYATVLDEHTDIFGCEAEAAAIKKYADELRGRGMGEIVTRRIIEKVAIRKAVDPQAARYISALFSKYKIEAAKPQAFGRPVELN